LKIYHFSGGGSDSERFFEESLVDYIKESGLSVPVSSMPDKAKIRKGPHGKPYLQDSVFQGVFFSRSHSKGHEVVCFSDGEIGIDCENTEARPGIESRYLDIAERCFTEDEKEYLLGSADDAIARFFEIWTAKEAYMKYTGKGFSEGFQSFSALNAPGVVIETGRLRSAPYVVYSVCTARKDM